MTLQTSHLVYARLRYFCIGKPITEICRELCDPDIANDNGFTVLPSIGDCSLGRRLKQTPKEEIDILRREYENSILDIPLARRYNRVDMLVGLLETTKSVAEKRGILRDIKEEVGETTWQEIAKDSGAKDNELRNLMIAKYLTETPKSKVKSIETLTPVEPKENGDNE